MRPAPGNMIEALDGELPASMVLLVAMLENQIDDLAKLHAKGVWITTPQEIGANVCRCYPKSGHYEAKMAMEEWLLWPAATESLLEALERYTPIRIDRGRIVSLALKRSAALQSDGRSKRWRGEEIRKMGNGEN